MNIKCELYNDHFQNFKSYGIPHAQLIIADVPYNLGKNAYASNPSWYNGWRQQERREPACKLSKYSQFCPKEYADMPSFLQELYGLMVMLTEWEYSADGKTKKAIGLDFTPKQFARYLQWNLYFTRRSIGILWKLGRLEYRNEKFFINL